MRALLLLVSVLALLWAGYWFVGARATESAIISWLDARKQEGWLAEVASVQTKGFPNRFDTTLNDVRLADPNTGVAWTGPFLQILSLSYRPTQIIAVFPPTHSISSPNGTSHLTSSDFRGSLALEPDGHLGLQRFQFVVKDLNVESTASSSYNASEIRLAARRSDNELPEYDIALEALNLAPQGALATLAQSHDLPRDFRELKVDTTILFDREWNRSALEDSRPQPVEINLKKLKAEWGDLLIQVNGEVVIDEMGVGQGLVNLQIRNWRDVLELAVDAGLVPRRLHGSVEASLGMLAGLSGNPKTIDTSISVGDGVFYIGPVTLGEAPLFKIR